MSSYYANKLEFLRDILGVEDIRLDGEVLVVGAQRYPIVGSCPAEWCKSVALYAAPGG